MNAGKSTTLLQADFNYRERGVNTMLWTAALDTRADAPIASRIGLEAVCHCGRKATMNPHVSESCEPVGESEETEIVGNEGYVALCRRHFASELGIYH